MFIDNNSIAYRNDCKTHTDCFFCDVLRYSFIFIIDTILFDLLLIILLGFDCSFSGEDDRPNRFILTHANSCSFSAVAIVTTQC